MALKDIPLGMVLPHRGPELIDVATVKRTAQRAEALGFRDLWVTENTLDHAFSFDPFVVLTYAAAVTSTIRLGTSVVVLPVHSPAHVAHQTASLDYLSGGRAVLGVGLGRAQHYAEFQVPEERRVRRFLEGVEVMKALWTQDKVSYRGEIYHFDGGIALKPVQKPHPPVWLGGTVAAAIRRAAAIADGWMGAGGQSTESFGESVPLLKAALEKAGRDPSAYPVSKRVFLSVHEKADTAKAEAQRWFGEVYSNVALADAAGVYGTPSQVQEQLEGLVAMGANHLLLNAVTRYEDQVEALAELSGLS